MEKFPVKLRSAALFLIIIWTHLEDEIFSKRSNIALAIKKKGSDKNMRDITLIESKL